MSNEAKPKRGATIEARDVMRSNARTAKAFPGRFVGTYKRVGPNNWDPYELVAEDGRDVDVPAGLEVQVEERGARIRVRAKGSVRVVEWIPSDDAPNDADELRELFRETCLEPFRHDAGIGATAFIVKTLDEG